MKKSLLLAAVLALSGCAGLDVEWQFNATYQTPELLAKRKAARLEALDMARAEQHAAEVARQQQP